MAFTDRLHNRGSISTGYDIDNSLKLEDDNSEGLTKNYSGDGDRRTWTYSTWIKRTELSQDYYCLFFAGYTGIQLMSENYLRVELYDGTTTRYADTNQLFRDTSAWYHIVVTLDSTDSTASDRVKIWINGSRVTDFRTSTYASMSQNDQFGIGQASSNYQFGHWFAGGANDRRFCGYVAETHYVNGTALEATDFGEYDSDSGIWIPKEYTGSHGSKGFYLKFDDSSNLGKDSSSGGIGDFTLSNITSADQATDTPTNNFAIGNANVYFSNPTFNTFNPLTEGATKITKGAGGWETLSSTIAVTSGKWYMEMQNIVMPETAMMSVFPADIEFIGAGGQINNYAGKVSGDGGISYYSYNGNIFYNASNASYGSAWANETNTMAIALDMDNGKVYFARANVWQNSGDPTSGATGTGAINLIEPSKPHMMGYAVYANNTSGAVNFGGYTPSSISSSASDANGYGTFEYAPPSGYYALCSKNLAEYG